MADPGMVMTRNPTGRRGKPPERRMTEVAKCRLTTAQYDDLCRLATRSRESLSDYIRERLFPGEHVAQT
jgi:hypothetical protein